jgi:hypothetical protein
MRPHRKGIDACLEGRVAIQASQSLSGEPGGDGCRHSVHLRHVRADAFADQIWTCSIEQLISLRQQTARLETKPFLIHLEANISLCLWTGLKMGTNSQFYTRPALPPLESCPSSCSSLHSCISYLESCPGHLAVRLSHPGASEPCCWGTSPCSSFSFASSWLDMET